MSKASGKMDASEAYPRLLLIDFTRVGGISATGQLKASLFRGWPAEACLHVYGAGFTVLRLAPDLWDPSKDATVESVEKALEIIKDFGPEVIYYRPVGDRDDLHDLAMQAITTLDLPLVTHMMDDWPQRMARSKPERAERFDTDLRALFERAHANLSICDAMTNAYGERYGAEFIAIANGVEDETIEMLASIEKDRKEGAAFRIRYMGGLAPDMTRQAVMDIVNAVETLRGDGLDVAFEIYTMAHWLKDVGKSFSSRDGVSIFKSVDKDRYYELIGDADVCLIAYNFDQKSIYYTKYSMANKLPEILASKATLLAYGPKQLATISYVQSLDIGLCVTERDQEQLVEALRGLIDRPEAHRYLSEEANKRVQRAHRMEKIRAQFCNFLRDAIDSKTQAALVAAPSGADDHTSHDAQEAPRPKLPTALSLAACAMHPAHAVVLPTFRRKDRLNDFLARAAWFFPQTGIERLTVFVSRQAFKDFQWQLPDGFDPIIATERFGRLEEVLDFVEITGQEKDSFDQQKSFVESAQLVYFYDALAKEQWSGERQRALLQGKREFSVDPNNDKNEGAAYLETSSKLLESRQALVDANKQAFLASGLLDQSYNRSIILATGPSISDYRRFDTDGAMVIACNSIIKSKEIMERVRPQVLVFADPIFHYGPSIYAAQFRDDLEQALAMYDFTIVTPMKYYTTLLDTVPSAAGRMVAVPFERECGVVMDLKREFRTRVTDNILTLLMLPLAYTFSNQVLVFGCDGRPAEDNTYFWKHQGKVQYVDKMSNIQLVHPGFFVMDYDDYYQRHMTTTERFLQMAEAQGKSFIGGGFSYIPAMHTRSAASRIADDGVHAGGQRSLKAMILDLGGAAEDDLRVLALMKSALEEVSAFPVEVASLQEEEAWWSDQWQSEALLPVLGGPEASDSQPWSQALLHSETGDWAPLTRALGEVAALDAQQSAGPSGLRQAVEGLLADRTGFIRSDLWEKTRVSLSAVLSEAVTAGPDGQAIKTEPGIYLNLSVPLSKPNGAQGNASNNGDASRPVVLDAAQETTLHLGSDDLEDVFSHHLSSWQGVVYCRTHKLAQLAEALRLMPWPDIKSIDLVVDVSEALLELSLHDQIAAGRAVSWLAEQGEEKLSTIRIRTTSEAVSRTLLGTAGLVLETAPPLDTAFRDKVWLERRRVGPVARVQNAGSTSRTLVVTDARSTKSRKVAEETAKALAQDGANISLYVRGGNEAQAITEDAIGKGHLKTFLGTGLEQEAFQEAALVVVVVQDLEVEQGFYDTVQKAVLFGLPLVLWSAGRLGAQFGAWEFGVAFDRFERNTIQRAIRATSTNLDYYETRVASASDSIGEAASWRKAAAGLFGAGLRPEAVGKATGLKPTGISMQGNVTHSGLNRFLIPKGGGQTGLLFIFTAPVQPGDLVRVEARVRAEDANLIPFRLGRHGSKSNEGSEPDAPGWKQVDVDEFLIWREYVFQTDHPGFRLEVGCLKDKDIHLEIFDVSAAPIN